MVELVVVIIILIVIACVKIYHATQRQAEREREYVAERKMCGCTVFCGIYAFAKAVLIMLATGSFFYIFVSLVMGEPIGTHHLTSSKFLITAVTSAIMFLPTIVFLVIRGVVRK